MVGQNKILVPALTIAVAAVAGVFMQYALFAEDKTGAALLNATFDYFSFFTVESNLLVAAVALAVAFGEFGKRSPLLARPAVASAACLYIAVTGTVYHLILSPLYTDLKSTYLFSMQVMHYFVPIAFVLFWLILIPKGTLTFRAVAAWMIFPAGYGIYTIVRGAFTGFYPYPFVDVATIGYPTVIRNIVLFTVGFGVAGTMLLAVDRLAAGSKRG